MTNQSRTSGWRWSVSRGLVVAAVVVAQATGAGAQATAIDARWQPWLGCWVPIQASEGKRLGIPGTNGVPEVCVAPVAGSSAVDISTIAEKKVMDETRVDAGGERQAVARDGCTGWESAQWAASKTRVYLQSEITCQDGVARASTGIIAMTRLGEWLDIQDVTVGGHTAVRVVRYQAIGDSSVTAAWMAARPNSYARSATLSRFAAERAATTADITDASQHVDASVVQAWLVQLDQLFTVDARQLKELAKANVPASVIDLVVALSAPDEFVVERVSDQTQIHAIGAPSSADSSGYTNMDYAYEYDPFAYYGYGYSPYGYGYGYGIGGYGRAYGGGVGGGTVVVVTKGSPNAPGHVVNGRGYTEGTSGTATGGTASGNASASSHGSSGASASPAPASAPAASAPPAAAAPARTAIPRPPTTPQ